MLFQCPACKREVEVSNDGHWHPYFCTECVTVQMQPVPLLHCPTCHAEAHAIGSVQANSLCPTCSLGCLELLQDTNPKSKFGAAKPSPALIPSSAILHEAKVFGLGAKKYGPYNWRKDPVSAMTYLNACLRHIQQIIDGVEIDPESGASHAAHARACLAIYIDAKECGKLIDDRPPAGPAERLIAEFTEKIE